MQATSYDHSPRSEELGVNTSVSRAHASDDEASLPWPCLASVCSTEAEALRLVRVQVYGLGGALLCESCQAPQATVGDLKWQVTAAAGIPTSEQRLVHGAKTLRDQDTLADAGLCASPADGPAAPVALHCIRAVPSIAHHLSERARSADPEVAIEGALRDLVGQVLLAEHAQSERLRPKGAEGVLRALHLRHRDMLVIWLVETFRILHFSDEMLHSTVLTLDRFFALKGSVEPATLQLLVLAVLCTEMKLRGAEQFKGGYWKHLLKSLTKQNGIEARLILQSEHLILTKLGFEVGAPTPATFLRELSLSRQVGELGELLPTLAFFLLELALFEPQLQYSYPHVVLAGAALGGALRSIEARVPHLEQTCSALRESLVDDVVAYSPQQLGDAEMQMRCCECQLLDLWVACANLRGEADRVAPFPKLEEKFQATLIERGTAASVSVSAQAAQAARVQFARVEEAVLREHLLVTTHEAYPRRPQDTITITI